ncbi:unnamed protein product, partial [Coregonus sp. 'balchen']
MCSGVKCPCARRVVQCGITEQCGCCPQCACQRGQVCGGPHWEKGYCDRPPCLLDTALCPWVWGCNIRAGVWHELWSEMKKGVEWGCELQGNQCVYVWRGAVTHPYHYSLKTPVKIFYVTKDHNQLLQHSRVELHFAKRACRSNVNCPAYFFPTEPYIPPGQCCPLVPAICNFEKCNLAPPTCPPGQQVHHVESGDGSPGACCHRYQCVQGLALLRQQRE